MPSHFQEIPEAVKESLDLASLCIHGDEADPTGSVMAPISLTTTFRWPDPSKLTNGETTTHSGLGQHVYSRESQPVTKRVEDVLAGVLQGAAVTYASGLAAAFSALLYFQPERLIIRDGYHGVHAAWDVYARTKGRAAVKVDLDDEYREGDLIWLETPLNPFGEARDIRHYSTRAHKTGCPILVDATLAPPPLQDPFRHGVDMVMHSATKYFGGHSDCLGGVLCATREAKDGEYKYRPAREVAERLLDDRMALGNMMGSLEAWLLLRSLRTLKVRVRQQSASGERLAQWLDAIRQGKFHLASQNPGKEPPILRVHHGSLQEPFSDIAKQHVGGHSATFAVVFRDVKVAEQLPHRLYLFTPATSLGGVESLIEQRVLSDSRTDPRLVRISIGLEDWEDLRDDLQQALEGLAR